MAMFLYIVLDHNRHGGGVLFYGNDQLESHLLIHLTESLWIKMCLDKTKPIFFSVVYRPPSQIAAKNCHSSQGKLAIEGSRN